MTDLTNGKEIGFNEEKYFYPAEPPVFAGKDLNAFLVYCYDLDASDITIKTNSQVWIEIHGKLFRATRKRLSKAEVIQFISFIGGNDSVIAHLNSGKDFDCSHSIKVSRDKIIRFRVNMLAILSEEHTGFEITLRTIIGTPRHISEMNLDPNLMPFLAPKQGMVLVTGATGSGKSTLLSSIIRNLLEDPDGNRKILTYESPIEFVYDNVITKNSVVSQAEIPKNLASFTEAIRNALRRAPDVILVGEMRDKETITEGVVAAQTGHLMYSTVHTNGVAETIRRMIAVYPENEKSAAAIDILSAIKVILSQMLVPSTDGKRVPIREYLVFDEQIVDDIFNAGIDKLIVASRAALKAKGKTFLQDAQEKLELGWIDEKEFNKIKMLTQAADIDAERKTV